MASRSPLRRARPSGTWRSAKATRFRTCATWTCRVIEPTAIAARAWSRSRASACWPRLASASRRPTWTCRRNPQRAVKSRQMVFELLASNMRPREEGPDNQAPFWQWASAMGISGSERYPSKFDGHPEAAELDLSNPAIAVNLDACIACGACVRACREVQVNDVIGMGLRGSHAVPVFDIHDPMGLSTCVTCGECVQACPTGALYEKSLMDRHVYAARRAKVRQGGRHAVSVLRRRLPDVGGRKGQPHRPGRRPQRLRERKSAVRQRPLRFRLRRIARAPDEAVDPPRRRAQIAGHRNCPTPSVSACSAKPRGKRLSRAPQAV